MLLTSTRHGHDTRKESILSSNYEILRQAPSTYPAVLLDAQRRRDNRKSCEAQLETSLSDRDHPYHIGFGSTGTPAFGSSNTGTGTTGGGLFGSNTASSFGAGSSASGGTCSRQQACDFAILAFLGRLSIFLDRPLLSLLCVLWNSHS